MSESDTRTAKRPQPDKVIVDIADYALDYEVDSDEAMETARYCLMDSLGCALLALSYPACTKLLGPIVPGAQMSGGVRIPGTSYELDPVQGAFNLGTMIRWLDFNDTWLAAEWGHPSDNVGGVLAVSDYLSRSQLRAGKRALTMKSVLTAMVKAHELQGIIGLENSFNRVGLDHVLLVGVASTAVVTALLGGTREDVMNAVSHAWIDGGALRAYRHAPNTGSRKSWAAGDATSRGVRLALLALRGEMGCPSAITTPTWGFQDALFNGESLTFAQGYGTYVMENVLFKLAFPAEFHAQTAVEAAITLHEEIADRLDEIDNIVVETQESALRIIDKTGPLDNPADRDHCLQYMVAVALLRGNLTAADYEDAAAADPRIDDLREKIDVVENQRFTEDYSDPDKRSIGSAVQVFLEDGSSTDRVEVEYPVGHRRRRAEGIPLLEQKFLDNIATRLSARQCQSLVEIFADSERLDGTPVCEFMDIMAL